MSNYVFFVLLAGLIVGLDFTYPLEVQAVKQIPDSIVESHHNNSIWDHLRANFQLKHYHTNANVQKSAKQYLNKSFGLTTILERGAPYLHFITQELEKRNLPAELVFLPLVESEYNPTARSHVNAGGLWQIMPATGRILGLEQNRWYDGRNDIYASTHAALDHLTYLNERFNGDWLKALAAYNGGEVIIDRAIKNNRAAGKPTDYWSLHIPYAETRAYVHRFLAIIDIIENADKYDIELPSIPNRPALVYVELQEKTDLKQAAKLTGLTLKEIYAYNPGIKRNVTTTPPNGPHHLLLPAKDVEPQMIARLTSTDIAKATDDKQDKHNYRVKAGDTLKAIANANDTSIEQLLAWNDQIKDPDLLTPGQLLNLYT